MDDLLSLMEHGECSSVPVPTTTTTTTTTNNNNESSSKQQQQNKKISGSSTPKNPYASSTSKPIIENYNNIEKKVPTSSSSMCKYTSLRISKRFISEEKVDELLHSSSSLSFSDMPMNNNNKKMNVMSCTNLSAATRQKLISFLVPDSKGGQPQNNLAGKTQNLAIIGLLIQKSPSKISKLGSAFTILSIGDFNTGPFLSLFVFGDAFTKLSSEATNKRGNGKGFVVLITDPVLMPPPTSSSSTTARYSFSVSETDQLHLVGVSQDFGICQGFSYSQINNQKVKKLCTKMVDTRISRCCAAHSKTQNSATNNKNKNSTGNQRGSGSGPQSLFLERRKQYNLQLQQHQNLLSQSKPGTVTMTSINSGPSMSYLQTKKTSILQQPPQQTTKKSTNLTNKRLSQQQRPTTSSSHQQQPKRKKLKISFDEDNYDGSVKIPKPMILTNAANVPTKSQQPWCGYEDEETKKNRVLEAQRQILLQRREQQKSEEESPLKTPSASAAKRNPYAKSSKGSRSNNSGRGLSFILSKQSSKVSTTTTTTTKPNIAARVNQRSTNSTTSTPHTTNSNSSGNNNSFFDSIQISTKQKDQLLTRKSKYDTQVQEQNHAKCHKRLAELVQTEERQEYFSNKKKNGSANNNSVSNPYNKTGVAKKDSNKKHNIESAIQKYYVCLTCESKNKSLLDDIRTTGTGANTMAQASTQQRRKFFKPPLRCIHLKHNVKCIRQINKDKEMNVRDRRLARHNWKGEGGGMVLAAGLDWGGGYSRYTS